MWLKDKVVNAMRSFLNIQEPTPMVYTISKIMDDQQTTYKNIIWYNGQANELSQLYSQIPFKNDTFWGSIQTAGLEIRKIHTGLPALIVDVLTNIIMTDYNGIDFDGKKEYEDIWTKAEEENNFTSLLEEAVKQSLYKGRGAFKLSLDPELSEMPIIEYFGKDKVEFVYNRGRLVELIFRTVIEEKNNKYILKEHYGYGYIKHELLSCDEKIKYNIKDLEKTEKLTDIEFDKSFMMAIPHKVFENAIYDKKTDVFDAYDEVVSQWMNAVRDGRVRTYIPEELIPRDKNGGFLLNPNSFDNKFIKTKGQMSEDKGNEVKVEQPNINVDSYMNTYIATLDMCTQGIISPATLGIDSKKITDPNATAQREKEKTTLWTRGKIVDSLNESIPKLVKVFFFTYKTMYMKSLEKVEVELKFGEYANPSFEAQVETISKGKQSGIMSIEASVDELYGDSKDEEWKKEEVARLKNEQGIVEMDTIPAVNNVLNDKIGGALDENIK